MLDFVKDNILAIISILIAYFGVVLPIYRYLIDKNIRTKELRFKTYHNLIKKLVQPELLEKRSIPKSNSSSSESACNNINIPCNIYGIMIDRQVGIIFELRNYPEYFEVTKRILLDLFDKWKNNKENYRIIREINFTLYYINTYTKPLFQIIRVVGLKRLTILLSNIKTRKKHF